MNRKYGHIVIMAMAALIGLLGCSRSSGGDDLLEPPTPIPTPTPTPTPEPEPTPDDDETAISFTCDVPENEVVTRGETPLSENTFKVWGYKNTSVEAGNYGGLQDVMPGYTVNKVDNSATTITNSDGWEYVNQQTGADPEQTIKYWDWGAAAYRFFGVTGGVAPSQSSGNYQIVLGVNTTKAEKIKEMNYFTTLWFSTGNLANYPDKPFGQPVKLSFIKPYSKVRFMFKFVFPREGLTLSGISFKPSNNDSKISRVGSIIVTYPLTGTQTKESYTVNCTVASALEAFTEDYDSENDSKVYDETDGGWYYVMPNNTQGSYTLTVSVNGTARNVVVPAAYMQWLPGYSYTYIFKVTEEGGVEIDMVQSAFTEWTKPEIDHNVYNW